jgi:hypothetical protein
MYTSATSIGKMHNDIGMYKVKNFRRQSYINNLVVYFEFSTWKVYNCHWYIPPICFFPFSPLLFVFIFQALSLVSIITGLFKVIIPVLIMTVWPSWSYGS